MKLVRRTSFWTSRAMLSTVPGFSRPNSFLRSCRLAYVSVMAAEMTLSVRKDSGDDVDLSSITTAMVLGWDAGYPARGG